ncbi:MAG: hypothetical protein GXP63_01820 [DPANN group archaeon]|nr:hypothetical protein [DPANN group archaeon]
MANVNIRLDKELHRQAKIICALRGITLSEFYHEILKRTLDKDIRLLEDIL